MGTHSVKLSLLTQTVIEGGSDSDVDGNVVDGVDSVADGDMDTYFLHLPHAIILIGIV